MASSSSNSGKASTNETPKSKAKNGSQRQKANQRKQDLANEQAQKKPDDAEMQDAAPTYSAALTAPVPAPPKPSTSGNGRVPLGPQKPAVASPSAPIVAPASTPVTAPPAPSPATPTPVATLTPVGPSTSTAAATPTAKGPTSVATAEIGPVRLGAPRIFSNDGTHRPAAPTEPTVMTPTIAGLKRKGNPSGPPDRDPKDKYRWQMSDWVRNGVKGRHDPGYLSNATNRFRPCELFVQAVPLSNEMSEVRPVLSGSGFKVKYNLDHQEPSMVFKSGAYMLPLHHSKFFTPPGAEDIAREFPSVRLVGEAEVTHEVVRNIMKKFGPEPEDEHIDRLVRWGTDAAQKYKGLHFQSFRTAGRIQFDHVSHSNKNKTIEDFVNLWNTRNPMNKDDLDLTPRPYIVVMVRRIQETDPVVEEYWLRHTITAIKEGAWSYYDEFKGKKDGELFSRFIEAKAGADIQIQFQEWMCKNRKSGSHFVYGTQKIRRSFGTMRAWAIVNGTGLIYEHMAEDKVMKAYFGPKWAHRARILEAKAGYVVLEVYFQRALDVQPPTIKEGDRFRFKYYKPKNAEAEDDMVDIDSTSWDDGEIFAKPPQPPQDGEKPVDMDCAARCIEVETKADFVLQVNLPASYIHDFVKGKQVYVSLWNKRNDTSIIRQLKAINQIATTVTNKSSFKRRKLNMQAILRGEDVPPATKGYTVYDQAMKEFRDGSKDTHIRVVEEWVKAVEGKLNTAQRQAFDAAIRSNTFLNLIQGPPGTGKTFTVATIGYVFGLLGYKTLMAAPTKVATMKLFAEVIKQHEALLVARPKSRSWFNIIYYPSDFASRSGKIEFGSILMAIDMLRDAESLPEHERKYHLMYHVIRKVRETASAPAKPGELRDAKDQALAWLTDLDGIRKGITLTDRQYNSFVDLTMVEVENVMKETKTKIIITTCNGAGRLADIIYSKVPDNGQAKGKKGSAAKNKGNAAQNNKPTKPTQAAKPTPPTGSAFAIEVCLIDEIAIAAETECLPALQLYPAYVILAGDHWQLRARAGTLGFNVWCNSRPFSIFERLYGGFRVPCVRLREQYRMHPDISFFPGMMSYGGLANAPNTLVDSSTYTTIKLLWESEELEPIRKFKGEGGARYGAEWGAGRPGEEKSIRRLFFNTNGSRSAPLPGFSSLRNFCNVNGMVDLAVRIANFMPEDTAFNEPVNTKNITMLTPYTAEAIELSRVLKLRWKQHGFAMENMPQVLTVDKFQGEDNEWVFLSLTPADGSRIGFLSQWNRINMALTRAKSGIWCFGNLESWRSELCAFIRLKMRKYALFIIDLLDKGDVIDIEFGRDLPTNYEETMAGPDHYTKILEEAPRAKLNSSVEKEIAKYKTDPAARKKLEESLLTELRAMERTALEWQQKFAKDETTQLPVDQNLEEEAAGAEKDHDMDDDDNDHNNDDHNNDDGDSDTDSQQAPVDDLDDLTSGIASMTSDTEMAGVLGPKRARM